MKTCCLTTMIVLLLLCASSSIAQTNQPKLNQLALLQEMITFINHEFEYENVPCKWLLTFADSTLTIQTIDNCYNCGFGGGVAADNIYKRISSTQPDSFEDAHGMKVYFTKTKPERYYR